MSSKRSILGLLIVLLVLPIVSAETATTSVSVLNVEPGPLRFWVDNRGPVEYNDTISEFLAMYYPQGCNTCSPVPYWDSSNPNNYVIRLFHPDSRYRNVPVRLELQDANGYDDVTEVRVSEMVNIKQTRTSRIPSFPLYLKSGSITRAIYSNTFRLYRDAPSGTWRIQFSIKDGAGKYYTKYGYYYLDEKEEDTKTSFLGNLIQYLDILK